MLFMTILMPLAGFVLNGLLGRTVFSRRTVHIIACGSVLISFLLGVLLFIGNTMLPAEYRHQVLDIYTLMRLGDFDVKLNLIFDPLSLLMLLVVTGVGFIIHVYSIGYMAHEESYYRFFAYMNLFIFMMLTLVLSGNFFTMFIGWEGVGLSSYLLIGFWYRKKSASDAAVKAFLTNRVGDFGFLLGMAWIFTLFGSWNFDDVLKVEVLSTVAPMTLFGIAALLFWGATAKSAQIPLFVWLPDAMEGPTPVSALIHAATMVTAGVYMVMRCQVLFVMAPYILTIIAFIGVATALVAATIALTRYDIKQVLAYSTISQLGYMFVACGVGAFAAAFFHLMTHAFFKALLFLGSGSVIHGMHEEQDMRRMGGLKKQMPGTFFTFIIGAAALSGLPLLSGFFSKDEILASTLHKAQSGYDVYYWFWAISLVTAGLTAFYTFRAVYLTFCDKPRYGHEIHPHESPKVMLYPLVALAVLSVIGGYVNVPAELHGKPHIEHYLHSTYPFARELAVHPAEHAAVEHHQGEETADTCEQGYCPVIALLHNHTVVLLISIAVPFIGLFFLYLIIIRKGGEGALAMEQRAFKNIVLKSFDNGWYIDKSYYRIFVDGTKGLARIMAFVFDIYVIDGAVNLLGSIVKRIAQAGKYLQTGRFPDYALYFFAASALMIILSILV